MKFLISVAILAILSLMLFVGCSAKNLERAQRHAVLAKCDELDQCYLSQDVDGARRCLHEKADLLERSTILEPIGRSALLAITYTRLYILENRAGKYSEADVNLINAKYWALKRAEQEGKTADIEMKEIHESTLDNLIASIDQKDRIMNNSKLPAYTSSLHLTNSP